MMFNSKLRLLFGAGAVALVGAACTAYFPAVCSALCNCRKSMVPESSPGMGIACLLSQGELQERKQNLLANMTAKILEIKPVDGGYAFRIASDDEILANIFEVIQAERKCCPFLTFKLDVPAENGPIWLEATGPDGTQQLLRDVLGLKQ